MPYRTLNISAFENRLHPYKCVGLACKHFRHAHDYSTRPMTASTPAVVW